MQCQADKAQNKHNTRCHEINFVIRIQIRKNPELLARFGYRSEKVFMFYFSLRYPENIM
jgi:hypothetical protein